MNALFQHAPLNESSSSRFAPAIGERAGPSPEVAALVAGFFHGRRGVHEGRDVKLGALAALAALTALRAPTPALRAHVHSALKDGATREEILTTVMEAALYSGFAAAHAGLEAALRVFADSDSTPAATS